MIPAMLRILIVSLSLLLASSSALAQAYYRWVDDEGEVHYGQSVPPEFKDYGYVRLGPDGTVRERVEPALSPEEIAERRQQRAEEAEREAERRSQASRDRLLTATFSSEQALIDGMEMQLAGIESQRASTETALELMERRFETLVARAAPYHRREATVPANLQEGVKETRAELHRLREEIERLEQRKAETRQRFMADLERYRELTGSGDDG